MTHVRIFATKKTDALNKTCSLFIFTFCNPAVIRVNQELKTSDKPEAFWFEFLASQLVLLCQGTVTTKSNSSCNSTQAWERVLQNIYFDFHKQLCSIWCLRFFSLPSGRSSKSSSSSSEPTEYSDWLSEMSACHSETAHGGLSIGQAHSLPLCKL